MSSENQTINKYSCYTQEGFTPTIGPAIAAHLPEGKEQQNQLVIGIGNIIPRWYVAGGNTKLQYYVKTESFPIAANAKLAGEKLLEAAKEWNDIGFGITISQAPDKKSAYFDLVYQTNGSETEGTLAQAFFPHEVEQDVVVFGFAFNRQNKDILKNVFLHELGHVLGLRHEFAMTEKGDGAVIFGAENPVSVMGYTFPPNIQDSDKDGIKAFYKEKTGTKIGKKIITDFIPTPRKIV